MTDVSGKQEDKYAYRLVNTEVPGRIMQMLNEEWEYCDDECVGTPGITLQDGSKIGSTKQIRESILMRMPIEIKKARDRYHDEKTKSPAERATEARNALGSTAYGEVQIS